MKSATQTIPSYTILATKHTTDPLLSAQLFSACLGADKGYSSTIIDHGAGVVDVVASDNRAIRFTSRR